MNSEDNTTIPGLKLIRHNAGGVDNPDDPTFPFRLDASFRPTAFMEVAHVYIFGNEELCVRGMTLEALERFVDLNNLRAHPRLRSIKITKP